MNKIKVIQLNNSTTDESARMACFGARLSQHAFELMSGSRSLDDFFKPESDIKFASKLAELPHYTLNRMTKINVLITGLSIRASRQLTRHQTDVVFMSASLQYEKILYSINASADEFFCVPSTITGDLRDRFLNSCKRSYEAYASTINILGDKDSASYLLPLALRQVLLVSATPYELAHIVSARTCKRNTLEVQHIAKLILKATQDSCAFMRGSFSLPECLKNGCLEGDMSCGSPFINREELEV